jgi:hypothetical protein
LRHPSTMLTHLRHAKVTAKDLRRTASLLDAAYDQATQIRIDGSMSDERINVILDNLENFEFAAFARLCLGRSRAAAYGLRHLSGRRPPEWSEGTRLRPEHRFATALPPICY